MPGAGRGGPGRAPHAPDRSLYGRGPCCPRAQSRPGRRSPCHQGEEEDAGDVVVRKRQHAGAQEALARFRGEQRDSSHRGSVREPRDVPWSRGLPSGCGSEPTLSRPRTRVNSRFGSRPQGNPDRQPRTSATGPARNQDRRRWALSTSGSGGGLFEHRRGRAGSTRAPPSRGNHFLLVVVLLVVVQLAPAGGLARTPKRAVELGDLEVPGHQRARTEAGAPSSRARAAARRVGPQPLPAGLLPDLPQPSALSQRRPQKPVRRLQEPPRQPHGLEVVVGAGRDPVPVELADPRVRAGQQHR